MYYLQLFSYLPNTPGITYLTPSLAIPALTLLPVISPLTESVFIKLANKPDILFHAKHNYVIAYLLNSPTIGYIIGAVMAEAIILVIWLSPYALYN